jgi:hypothetical protein
LGYTTNFVGSFKLNKKLDDETYKFLVKFNGTRRMKRKVDAKYGVEGEFFIDGKGELGQDNDDTVIDHNKPPSTQPSLWCQWRPSEDKKHIEWDEGEKFYDYVIWLRYIIKNFLAPKGYALNGDVGFIGEDSSDKGIIVVRNNLVAAVADMSFDNFSRDMIAILVAEETDNEARECLKIVIKKRRS